MRQQKVAHGSQGWGSGEKVLCRAESRGER